MDELVTVATFTDLPEAELARERLGLEGIQAFVIDALTGALMPYLAESTGIRLQVAPRGSGKSEGNPRILRGFWRLAARGRRGLSCCPCEDAGNALCGLLHRHRTHPSAAGTKKDRLPFDLDRLHVDLRSQLGHA